MGRIDEAVMLEAVGGHIERLGLTSESFNAALGELDTDATEVQAALGALVSVRNDGSIDFDPAAYAAAALDGFYLGVRAARIAESKET